MDINLYIGNCTMNNMNSTNGTMNNLYVASYYSNDSIVDTNYYSNININIMNSNINNGTCAILSASKGNIYSSNMNKCKINNLLVSNGTMNSINTSSLNIGNTKLISNSNMIIILPSSNYNNGNILSTNGIDTTLWIIPYWNWASTNSIYTNYKVGINTNSGNSNLNIVNINKTAINISSSMNIVNNILNIVGANNTNFNIISYTTNPGLLFGTNINIFPQITNLYFIIGNNNIQFNNNGSNNIILNNSTNNINLTSTNKINLVSNTNNIKLGNTILSPNNITDFSANPPTTNFSISANSETINYIRLIIGSNPTAIIQGFYMLLCYSSIKQNNNTTNLSTLVFIVDYDQLKSYLINSTVSPIWLGINYLDGTFRITNQMQYPLAGLKFYLYRYI